MEQLVLNFHSLEGNKLSEKRKSFNSLVAQIRRDLTSDQDLNTFITSIVPKHKLEEVLKLELLIRFQRHDELLHILKGGNPFFIRKVLNYWKFFEDTFQTIDARTLVNDILPHTSFSTRMKVITKLSTNLKNEELADRYFKAIDEKYGLLTASGILPACSLDLIKSTVEKYHLKLLNRQLMKIVRKHREFLDFYFGVLRKANRDFNFSEEYAQVLKYVAKVDVELFWELFDTYNLNVKFGRHMTPHMIQTRKSVVKNKDQVQRFAPKKLYDILKKDEQDLHEFFLNLYPKDIVSFYSEFTTLKTFFKCVPKHKKYTVLNKCFKESYGKELHETPKDIPEDILRIMPVKEREILVDDKVFKDEAFIFMYTTGRAISKIKERIKCTSSANQRAQLVELLYKTCEFNEDQAALLDILKYVRARHKNDNRVLTAFMNQLCCWPRIESLSTDHWTCISDLIKIFTIDSKRYYPDLKFMYLYLTHLIDNNLPCEEFGKKFLKFMKERGFGLIYMERLKYEKKCLEQLGTLIPTSFEGEDLEDVSTSFLETVLCYNYTNPKEKIWISNFKEMVEAAKCQLSKVYWHGAQCILQYCVRFERERNSSYDQWFWEYYEKLQTPDILMSYLKTNPLKVQENVDLVLMHKPTNKLSPILRMISMLSFTNIPQKVENFALDALQKLDFDNAIFSVAALSHLTTEQQYFEAIKPFLPRDDGKIDYDVKDKLVLLQEALAKSLVDIQNPSACLPTILQFCKGDYLKYALAPLHHLMSYVPKLDLTRIFDSLYSSAVSVRKHAVYLISVVAARNVVHDFLTRTGECEQNASLQKAVIKSTLRYFVTNPDEISWHLLESNIKIMDKDDREAFTLLVNLKKIPVNYLPQYIPLVYETLANNADKEIHKKRYELLEAVPDNILDGLDREFLRKGIRDTLLNPKCPSDQKNFCVRCLFYTNDDKLTEVFDLVFEILKNYVSKTWSDQVSDDARWDINNFVNDFCHKSIASKIDVAKVVRRFAIAWKSVIADNKPDEHLIVEFTEAYLNGQPEDRLLHLGAKANELLVKWVGAYGASVTNIFADILLIYLDEFLRLKSEQEKLFTVVQSLFSTNKFPYVSIAVLKILQQLSINDIKTRYVPILTEVRECKVPVVQVHFSKYLKNIKS